MKKSNEVAFPIMARGQEFNVNLLEDGVDFQLALLNEGSILHRHEIDEASFLLSSWLAIPLQLIPLPEYPGETSASLLSKARKEHQKEVERLQNRTLLRSRGFRRAEEARWQNVLQTWSSLLSVTFQHGVELVAWPVTSSMECRALADILQQGGKWEPELLVRLADHLNMQLMDSDVVTLLIGLREIRSGMPLSLQAMGGLVLRFEGSSIIVEQFVVQRPLGTSPEKGLFYTSAVGFMVLESLQDAVTSSSALGGFDSVLIRTLTTPSPLLQWLKMLNYKIIKEEAFGPETSPPWAPASEETCYTWEYNYSVVDSREIIPVHKSTARLQTPPKDNNGKPSET